MCSASISKPITSLGALMQALTMSSTYPKIVLLVTLMRWIWHSLMNAVSPKLQKGRLSDHGEQQPEDAP
jgi:hypothetical protein